VLSRDSRYAKRATLRTRRPPKGRLVAAKAKPLETKTFRGNCELRREEQNRGPSARPARHKKKPGGSSEPRSDNDISGERLREKKDPTRGGVVR